MVSRLIIVAKSTKKGGDTMDEKKDAAPARKERERQDTSKAAGASERELLIRRYESMVRQCEQRLAKLKAGASPGDVIF